MKPRANDIPAMPALALTSAADTQIGLRSVEWRRAPAVQTGIICNPKSHRNRISVRAATPFVSTRVTVAAPKTKPALREALADFAARGIELLVIDGGDGTVRDVLSCADEIWAEGWPRIAIVPSGKTNALALDLGIPRGWTLEEAMAAAERGNCATRRAMEISTPSRSTKLRGFLFGAGAFVSATALAQRTHRIGAFNGVAVALALGWGVMQTLFGRDGHGWRAGHFMRMRHGDGITTEGSRYLLVASTLRTLPVGLRPFGRPRDGLKTLAIDAPPRFLAIVAPVLLKGSEGAWIARAGYHRRDEEAFSLSLDDEFVLDGERYPGGALQIAQTAPIRFVVP